MASILDRKAIVAPKHFNRWFIPAAALAIHLCIGQVYAFSVFKIPLMSRFDVGEVSVGWIFSVAIAMLGLSAAFGGTWVEKSGPRKSMVVAGTAWVLGFFVAALGIATGQLWLVYFGYGFIGGIGLGIGYIAPVSTLMKWFPDRPGLATGLAIMGFGGGALIASPMSNALMVLFGGGTETENLASGLVPTFVVLALSYAVIIAAGAYVIRLPHPDWTPDGWDPSKVEATPMQTNLNVSANKALKTPQFWFLWIILFTNVTAGIGILENAAPMIQDYFPGVTAAAAAGFVGILSLANMGGRFIWSTASDYVGRKNITCFVPGRRSAAVSGHRLLRRQLAGAVHCLGNAPPLFLRRWFLYDPRVPSRYVWLLPGRRDSRSHPHRLGGCRYRRTTDRQQCGRIPVGGW